MISHHSREFIHGRVTLGPPKPDAIQIVCDDCGKKGPILEHDDCPRRYRLNRQWWVRLVTQRAPHRIQLIGVKARVRRRYGLNGARDLCHGCRVRRRELANHLKMEEVSIQVTKLEAVKDMMRKAFRSARLTVRSVLEGTWKR